MTAQCITCQSWQLKSSSLAREGMAPCAFGNRWDALPPQHTCARHKAIAPEAAEKRILWLGRLDAKHNNKRTA